MTFLAVAQGLSHGKPCFNSLWESHFFLSYSRDITNIALSFPYVPLMKLFFIIRERQYGLLLQCFKVVFHLAKGKVLINLPILSSRGLLTWLTLLSCDSSLGQKDTKPKVYTLPKSILWITLIYDFCFDFLVFVVKMMTMMMVTIMIIFDTIARSFTETLQLAMF